MMRCFSDDVLFAVHPPETVSFVGQGRGKAQLAERIGRFLLEFEVLDYGTVSIVDKDAVVDCRVRYHYRHRTSGMEIDGTMRHVWRVEGGKIVSFDVIHDAKRMGAFFELAARECSA